MATGHVKVYEDKRRGMSIWSWLAPLLILLALLAWFLTRRHAPANETPAPAATATAAAAPTLGAVNFATDQATLTPADQTTLTQAAAYMKSHPEARLRLEGYTDATGTEGHNLSLSDRRNAAVADFLEGQGIPRSRLTGEGFGPANPVASNDTASGKADNRRVELFQQQ